MRADFRAPGEKAFLDGRDGGFLLNCLADFFVNARDSNEDRRPNFLHRLRELVEVGAVDDLRAMAIHDVVKCSRGDMGERKEGDAGIGFVEGEPSGRKVLVGGDVAMRKHDAFGFAGGAGGVNERCEVVWLRRIERGRRRRDRDKGPASSAPARILEKGIGAFWRVAIHDEDALELGFRTNGVELVELLAGGDDGNAASGVGEKDGDLIACQAWDRWER